MKLGIISTHLIQYFSPLYRAVDASDADCDVLYFRQVDGSENESVHDTGFGQDVAWDVDLTGGYPWTSLGLRQAPFHYSPLDYLRIARGVIRWARTSQPDVVLIPGWTPPYLVCALALRAARVPLISRPEARRVDQQGLGGATRRIVVRAFVKAVRGFAVIGSSSHDELIRLGVPEHACFESPYTIDDQLWASLARDARSRRSEIREDWGVDERDTVFITVAKMLPYKNPLQLVEVFALVNQRDPRTHLVMVGDGVLKQDVERRIEQLGLDRSVSLLGFVNQAALPAVLTAADVFVLLSNETWGLAANEALACGLPLAVSDGAGCARDLVTDGVTGFRLPVGDIARIVERLVELTSADLRLSMTGALARLAERYTIQAASAGILATACFASGERSTPHRERAS